MIRVNEPKIEKEDLANVTKCLNEGWVSSVGPYVEAFENSWAQYCGRRYGIAVSNGTAALDIAFETLDLKPQDEVIVPSFTIISALHNIVRSGARPVLVDSDPLTWGMDVAQVEAKITSKTRAIVPIHIYGHPVDLDPILELAESSHIPVLEDAAEAHGAEYLTRLKGKPEWRRCGSFGEMSCFSFYANKIVTCGEGGMVLTDDPEIAERLRRIRDLCFIPGRRFYHQSMGYNYRLTNLQAALALGQIARMSEILEKKRSIAKRYEALLSKEPDLQLPCERDWAKNVYWMYGVLLKDSSISASQVMASLLEMGIETRPFFLGMHEQPVFLKQGLFVGESYPVTERLSRQGFYLPSGLNLTERDQEEVVSCLKRVLQEPAQKSKSA